MIELDGLWVHFNPDMVSVYQYRFPRTKNRRIRRKWTRRPQNWRREPWRTFLICGHLAFVHPEFFIEYCQANCITIETDYLGCTLRARRCIPSSDLTTPLTCPTFE